MMGQSLFRSYGRFFAEFLSEGSLVGLGLLDPSTGVGLRYGRQKHKLTSFSGHQFTQNRLTRRESFIRLSFPKDLNGYHHETALVTQCELLTTTTCSGILTWCPSPTQIRLGLGPTNPGTITVALETLLLRPTGFLPVLRLLIPAFSLDTAPPYLTIRLHRNINAPLPLLVN